MSEGTLKELLTAVEEADHEHSAASEVASRTKDRLEQCKEALLQAMIGLGTESASNSGYSAKIVKKSRPNVKDWDAFYKYLKRSGDLQLFERRIAAKAFAEIMEIRGGKDLPGVTTYTYQTLKLS